MSETSAMLEAAVVRNLTARGITYNRREREIRTECKIKNLICFFTQQTTNIEFFAHIYESGWPRMEIVL